MVLPGSWSSQARKPSSAFSFFGRKAGLSSRQLRCIAELIRIESIVSIRSARRGVGTVRCCGAGPGCTGQLRLAPANAATQGGEEGRDHEQRTEDDQ